MLQRTEREVDVDGALLPAATSGSVTAAGAIGRTLVMIQVIQVSVEAETPTNALAGLRKPLIVFVKLCLFFSIS